METIAKQILQYHKKYEELDKTILVENIEKYLSVKYPECSESFEHKMKKLEEITGAKRQAAYAWVNRGRKNIKIPFVKMCIIADALDIDIDKLLEQNNN